ncbi:LamG-like jellyroll fold domain-containing protein [Paenibacillus swuensis]|nr:LamG-like jellyroll fold domain-containing protein [Paenibacillus swuensis]
MLVYKRLSRFTVWMMVMVMGIGMMATTFSMGAPDAAAERQSVTFQPTRYAVMNKAIEKIPTTVEAWVKLKPAVNTRQIIIGNYKDGTQNSWSLELTSDNRLRYWEEYVDAQGVKRNMPNLYVTGVDVATNEWMLLSVVRDVTNKAILFYKNGVKVFERTGYTTIAPEQTPSTLPMLVGTDYRKSMWLNGQIAEIRTWDDLRTPAEIAQYAAADITGSESGLSHAWRLSDAAGIYPTTTFMDMARTNPVNLTAEGFLTYPYPPSGASFANSSVQYAAKNRLSSTPRTFEARVKLPKDLQGNRGGVIAGNFMDMGYYNYDMAFVNFEVTANGEPRLYWKKSGVVQDMVFTGVDLRQDRWMHVALAFDDAANEIRCYLDGELMSVRMNADFQPEIPAQALKIGGDYRANNTQYFKGGIADVRVWSTVRSKDEIAAHLQTEPVNPAGLLGSWKFDAPVNGIYADKSSHSNDITAFADWIEPNIAKGDHSLVFLPDTQFLASTYPNAFYNLTNWIKANKQEYNIQAVMSLGDIVDTHTSTTQWQVAQNAMNTLDGVVPYMMMPGNHDMRMSLTRETINYNKYFPYDKFSQLSYFGGAYKMGYMDNVYYYVTAGSKKYMIFSIAFAPTADILRWMNEKIAANPDKNVIITTHSYLYWNGEQSNANTPATSSKYISDAKNADEIWNDVASRHKNVVLVVSGHIGYPDIAKRVDTGVHGNRVHQMLADAQGMDLNGGLGMLMMLTFHKDSNKVDVNWYSTEKNKLFRERNQFSLDLNVVQP